MGAMGALSRERRAAINWQFILNCSGFSNQADLIWIAINGMPSTIWDRRLDDGLLLPFFLLAWLLSSPIYRSAER